MKVQGSQKTVPAIEIGYDTVYLHSNITKISEDEYGNCLWEYDEVQMPIDKYFRSLIPNNEAAIGELSLLFATYQQQTNEALNELRSLIGGATNV